MTKPISNNKRIAKNTLLLYFRQIITMLVSLYTVRIVLKVLGVEDYGIYNVVGGIVTMFSFLSGTMSSASQRYFAYDLGRKDYDSLSKTFSLTFISYIGIAAIIFVLCEIGGVWFLNNKMTIPPDRMEAANWTLQAALLSFVLTIMTLPYMAVIIARERMNAYAYVSILEVGLKLLIVFVLQWIDYDKLKTYAILTVGSTFIITMTYRMYCKKNFRESHFVFYWNWARLKGILSYAGWNMIGTVSNILRSQGINILLNLFFNPAVNAARGIAYQINTAVTNFTNNFFTAVRPQIIKRYAMGDQDSMLSLVYKSSLYAFFLLALIEIPIFFKIDSVLEIWLDEVPEYSLIFCKLILATSLIEVFSQPLVNVIQATGKVKSYQIVISCIYLLNIPISYTLLRLGHEPEMTMIVSLILVILCFVPRLILAKKIAKISIFTYLKKVILKASLISIVLISIAYGLTKVNINLFIYGMLFITFGILSIYLFGIDKNDKTLIIKHISNNVKKNHKEDL